MDTFNFNRFFREIKSEYSSKKAIGYLKVALSKQSIDFPSFWQIAHKEISNHKFLSIYFKSETSSPEILHFFIENNPVVLKSVIKEAKAFMREIHFESILAVFNNDPVFIKEIIYWKGLFHEMNLKLKEQDPFLSNYNIEELLVLLGFYYEKERITNVIERNTDYYLIEIINEILNRKFFTIKQQGKTITGAHSNESLYQFGIKLIAELIFEGDLKTQELFYTFQNYVDLQNVYDKYCVQEFTLSFFDDKTANVKPTNESAYLKYRHDGKKYQYWQNYYYNRLAFEYEDVIEEIESSDRSWYNKIGEKNTWANLYQFLDGGFTDKIQVNEDNAIDAFAFFRTINSLAGWSNIRWNNLVEQRLQGESISNPYKIILEIMIQNEQEFNNSAMPVMFREFDILVKQSEEINKTEKDTGRLSISLFSNNISDPKTNRINISDKPFIKIGRNLYWISGILSNKNYAVMLQNILLQTDRKKDEESPTKLYSKNAEDNIVHWFNQNAFTTIGNHKYIVDRGEIDLLALKENTLFVGEIKSTFHRSTVREIHMHLNNEESGIKKAISQLEKDIEYLKINWKDIKRLLKTELNFTDLKIVPLAISSTLEEGQGKISIGGLEGFIVSSFDLTIILTNRKFYLLNIFEVAMSVKFKGEIPIKYIEVMMGLKNDTEITSEINNILMNFIEENAEHLNFNLWEEGNMLCSPDDLYKALDEGLLWNFIGKNDGLAMKNILVGDYTINYFD